MRRGVAWLAVVAVVLGTAVAGQDYAGPKLSAAANFSQGWRPDILDASEQIPVLDFRDTVHWAVAEKPGQRYDFRGWRTSFPGVLKARGKELGLFLNALHPGYDGGDTAHSAVAVAAFGAYAAQVVAHYPNIRSVEVGNEFNGEDFVRGPARTQDMAVRAGYYVASLKAVYDAVKHEDPDIRVIGGAAHSIPVEYLAKVFAAEGGRYMDTLAIHTYDTAAEQLVRQIAVLRKLPEAADLPIEVTEFGTLNGEIAPGLFMRNYCQMALSGVVRAVWYPLHPRGDGLEPLLQEDGTVTPVGQAYKFAQAEFAGVPVTAFVPDQFTYGCVFGSRRLVIWGEPRDVQVSDDVSVFSVTGQPLGADDLRMDRGEPLVLIADQGVNVLDGVQLGAHRVIADSFHQFAYPGFGDVSPWRAYFTVGGRPEAFQTMPGQERQGVPWVPYLGHADHADLRLAADFLVPTGSGYGPVEVVHAFLADAPMDIEVDGFWDVGRHTTDGIRVSVQLNGREIWAAATRDKLQVQGRRVSVQAGNVLSFHVGPNGSPVGDYTAFRVTLRKDAAAEFPDLEVR